MTAIDDIARHGHGVDDEDTSGHLPRHAALDPRDGCPDCRWEECRCPNLAARLLRDLANPMPCRRCDNAPESNRTCAACVAELVAKAERDAEARTVLTSLRGLFDPMTGRPAGGGW